MIIVLDTETTGVNAADYIADNYGSCALAAGCRCLHREQLHDEQREIYGHTD